MWVQANFKVNKRADMMSRIRGWIDANVTSPITSYLPFSFFLFFLLFCVGLQNSLYLSLCLSGWNGIINDLERAWKLRVELVREAFCGLIHASHIPCVTHRYLKDRKTEKRGKTETVLKDILTFFFSILYFTYVTYHAYKLFATRQTWNYRTFSVKM